jgi:5-bromo-4-chloroindolyl phosphate hydrolysis protein
MHYTHVGHQFVCLEEIRNITHVNGTIYIDFKCGNTKTIEVWYEDINEARKEFVLVCDLIQHFCK